MPKKKLDGYYPERKRVFKPTPRVGIDPGYDEHVNRPESEIDLDFEFDESNVKTKRVRDLLKALTKFDDDIVQLQGIYSQSSDATDPSISTLSIEEMQEELKKFLLERDKIRTNLVNLVNRVNKTSIALEGEEEKIRLLHNRIQLKKEKESGVT